MIETYSQAKQDLFVLEFFNYQRGLFFVDLGSNHPIKNNNTYLLEKNYNWSGISVEMNPIHEFEHNKIRKSKLIVNNALRIDFQIIFDDFLQKNNKHESRFDYLSLDLFPNTSLACLQKLIATGYLFSVITYEHDRYRCGDIYRNKSREILLNRGYKLIQGDVSLGGKEFEDWWGFVG